MNVLPSPVPGPLSLEPLFMDWRASFGEPRGDEHRLHGSDLGGCDFATMLRLEGKPQIPPDENALEYWRRGHFIEAQAEEVFKTLPSGWTYERGQIVDAGIVGHLDFVIDNGFESLVVDVSTTAGKTTDWKVAHAMKSAFYAMQIGSPMFCEWVFQIGFGGVVRDRGEHWFSTEAWRPIVEERSRVIRAVESGAYVPPSEPPTGSEWLCKSFCAAECWRNERLNKSVRADLRDFQEGVPL